MNIKNLCEPITEETVNAYKWADEAMAEREEQYRTIVENSHDAIYIFRDNKIIYANENLCRLLCLSQEEIKESNVLDYIYPEDKMMIRKYIDNQKNGDQTFSACEARIISKTGQLKFIELNLTKSLYRGKETFIWAIRDITERKTAEKLQKALYRISETANSSLDLEELYHSVHRIIGELILAENFYIALYDENKKIIDFPYFFDEKDENPGPQQYGNGITDYVIRTGKPLFISRESHEQLIQEGIIAKRGTFSVDWLGVPLKNSEDRTFGVIAVQTHKEGSRYTKKDQDILSFVSNQVAMVIKRKQDETHLQYLSFRDSLSGLYNRRYFEEEMRRMDQRRQGSVGVIVTDVDGLKLINDMFGHDSGDKLLSKAASVLLSCFREQDIVARIGGDEYAILFHDIDQKSLEDACERLKKHIEEENLNIDNPPLSLSIGFAVSDDITVAMRELFKQADSNMYREKMARGERAQKIIVHRMMELWEKRDFIAEGHGDRMQAMVIKLGEQCGLTVYELNDLCLLAQFHDVGKIGIMESILLKPGLLTTEERKEIQCHSEMGHRIARSSPDLIHIAELILKHHEWWNGEGYPLGLAGGDIPLICRIVAIADAYDAMTNDRPYRRKVSHDAAIAELKRCAGTQFDPGLVEKFTSL